LHWVIKPRKTLRFSSAGTIGHYGNCVRVRIADVRVRIADVRVIRLENRQRLTPFVSSNLTLCAKR
jgi:hypothetical protein